MGANDGLQRIVQVVNSNKKYPALNLVRNQLDEATVISKLVTDPQRERFNLNKAGTYHNLNTAEFQAVSDTISTRIKDSDNIMRLFPDLELAAQILVSSILSPKDMVSTEVKCQLKQTAFPSALKGNMLRILEEDLEKYYKIKQILPDIIRECLFSSGSYVKAVLPESAIDEIINSSIVPSTESFSEILERDSVGILGPATIEKNKTKLSMESIRSSHQPASNYETRLSIPSYLVNDTGSRKLSELVEVTDNFKYLKLPMALESLRKKRITDAISGINRVGMESYAPDSQIKRFTNTEISSMFFRRVETKEVPFVQVHTKEQTARQSIGRPLEMKIPTEATIPVYVPGDPKNHVGYFVILDEEGNPITYEMSQGLMGSMSSALNDPNNAISSMLTQKAHNNLLGLGRHGLNLTDKAQVYMGIVENDLVNRLKNGIYGNKLEVARRQEIYQIMLARTLAGQYTRLLYIPIELITYFAFKYHDNGTGQSLYDDLSILTSLRAILLFSKVMATAKNSIAITKVNMTLDPNDADPQKTIEMSVNEILRMRQQYFPLGINTPIDLVEWVQRAGFEFTFEGHPGLPNTKFDFESKNFDHQIPDTELEELLRKQTIQALGLSPETVDNGFSSEFATTVVANNILMSKRVIQYQDMLEPKLADYVSKVIQNDFTLRGKLRPAIKEKLGELDKYLSEVEKEMKNQDEDKFIEYLIDKFATLIEVTLPKPNMTTIESLGAAYDSYSEYLDKLLDQWISSEFVTGELVGDFADNVDAIKMAVKAHYLRKWMVENNFMTELVELVTSDEDGEPSIDVYDSTKEHMQGLMKSCLKFIKSLQATKAASDKDLNGLGVEGEGEIESSSSSTETTKEEGGEEPDMGGMDDFASLGGSKDISGGDIENL